MHITKRIENEKNLMSFLSHELKVGHFEFSVLHLIIFAAVLFILFITGNNFWFILVAIGLNQIVFHLSEHIFHRFFNMHAEIELMFIFTVIGTYYFGLLQGIILAVLGSVLVKGQSTIECNFETFIHDIPNRIIIVLGVFFLKGFMSLSFLGICLSIIYFGILHSLHELRHHHLPIFELPTIIVNLIVSTLFFQIFLNLFL